MRLSDNGRALIKGFEGLSLKAYPDTKKGYSIGYGHFGAKPGDVITREEADRLFDGDVAKYELAVTVTTPEALQHEFDAMTSLAYNIGTAGFSTSTVAKKHNMGDRQGAADAFRMWKKSDGADNPVLIARREKERAIYLNGYGTPGGFPPPPATSTPVTPPPSPSSTAPSTGWPDTSSATPTKASLAGLLALAFGWVVYRLVHR